ncbi:ATP-binding protein [Actinacidiphila sp. ITFR-21]|uniref:ATP-binding protein n=1 Tax=Actinacidiphila sp. ITFR-21 TaxID=3075199 RepID=UPI00288A6DA2|nr:ATP-binding protein [Streptomyces sp. ITFR-21]WNI19934.1 ATP-binding protein [Streptomyces sp. ITFR-21]
MNQKDQVGTSSSGCADQPAAVPPMPTAPPAVSAGRGAALEAWLLTPRRPDGPGIYAFGHTPRPPADPDRIPDRRLVGTAAGALVGMWLTNSAARDYLYWLWVRPLVWTGLAPNSGHRWTLAQVHRFIVAQDIYTGLWWVLLAIVFGRAGHWPEAGRRYVLPALRRAFPRPAQPAADPAATPADPAEWPQLRAAGRHTAADRLAADLAAGRMSDVDHARLTRAWSAAAAAGPAVADAFVQAVVQRGAAACPHPSGARGLQARVARHDLMTGQVRLGTVVDDPRNAPRFRGVGAAVEPAVLGTSVVAVGPSGSGKTWYIVRPVVESLCLQALTGAAVVVAVGTRGAGLGPDGSFDVVITAGDPDSAYGLDLYGGTSDPDAAAALLSAALLDGSEGERADLRRAVGALAQVLGPFRAARGRFPSVAELRALLDGDAAAVTTLREQLDEAAEPGWARELDARSRQAGRAGDVGALLADRVALLDRPALAGFFDSTGRSRPFALTLEQPVRVRVDLPQDGHTEASRILTRLLLAQFTVAATARADRSLFAGLVLDDATHTVTAESVQALQRLRPAHAGVVMALRGLDDVPEDLRGPLLGAAGCRIALAGISTWDGRQFARAWGTAWVEDSDVTRTPDQSGGATRRLARGIRRLLTGEAVTTQAVTVRRVERDRWSSSDLAAVPAGHAVLSVTAVTGETAPPMLVDLRG